MASNYETNAGNIWTEIGLIEDGLDYIRNLTHEHGEIPDAASHMDDCVNSLAAARTSIENWSAAGFKALGEEIEAERSGR